MILIASGSEVAARARGARATRRRGRALARRQHGLRGGSSSSQDADYRESVLPLACRRRLAVEAGVTLRLGALGRRRRRGHRPRPLRRLGAGRDLFEQFGFTADNVYARAKALLA